MRILLVNVDSKLPNLALMKIAAYHQSKGDTVGFNVKDPDRIYASIVFKKNRWKAEGIKTMHPGVEVIVGGSGYDLKSELPSEIEWQMPDYSLYPGIDYSMGFTSRGCIRNCYFCIVPKKEGLYQIWQHPRLWHPSSFKKAKLFDNNWYVNKEWFFETSQWFMDQEIAIDVTQGMDIRLLTPEIAQRLKELRWWAPIHFAFDDDAYENKVLDGIEILRNAGINPRGVLFLVYCHDNSQYLSALRRCEVLKAHGATGFVMWNMDNRKKSQFMKDLIHTVNRPWIYWSPGSLEGLPHAI